MSLRRPVGLRRREPIGEESDYTLRGVQPATQHAIDRRQAKRRAELVQRPLEFAINDGPVDQPEKRPLEPHRLRRRDAERAYHPGVDETANHAGLQVHCRCWYSESVLRDASSERDAGGCNDRIGIRMRLDQAIDSRDCRHHHPPRDDLESSAPMP